MGLIIRGIKINTGETFQQRAESGIEKINKLFILNNFKADIALRKIRTNVFGVKILFSNKEYGVINVKSTDNSAIHALSASITKIEKIIRRLHRKIKANKRHISKNNQVTLSPPIENETSNIDSNGLIIANMNYNIQNLSVAEASDKLINSNRKILMFRNAAHLGLNLLLKNTNGTIEWIDPRGSREAIKL